MGVMSALLIVIVQRYGLPGLRLTTLMAGAIILALGNCKLGRIVNFIPAPVITGFERHRPDYRHWANSQSARHQEVRTMRAPG